MAYMVLMRVCNWVVRISRLHFLKPIPHAHLGLFFPWEYFSDFTLLLNFSHMNGEIFSYWKFTFSMKISFFLRKKEIEAKKFICVFFFNWTNLRSIGQTKYEIPIYELTVCVHSTRKLNIIKSITNQIGYQSDKHKKTVKSNVQTNR